MKKLNKSKRLRKKKKRKNRKSGYATSTRIAVETQRAQIDKQRTDEFHRKIINDGKAKKNILTIPSYLQ